MELAYHLRLADGSYEAVPMGTFEVSEANRTAHVLELKAYDYMLRFDRDFNGFETIGTAYGMMALCSTACGVELAQARQRLRRFLMGQRCSPFIRRRILKPTGMCCISQRRCWAASFASIGREAGISPVWEHAGDGDYAEAPVLQQLFGFCHQIHSGQFHQPADADG